MNDQPTHVTLCRRRVPVTRPCGVEIVPTGEAATSADAVGLSSPEALGALARRASRLVNTFLVALQSAAPGSGLHAHGVAVARQQRT